MDLELAGKTALITGASKGIGRAVADALAAEGCNLVLTARSGAMLDEAASALRQRHQIAVATIAADLSRTDDQERVARAGSHVDILVNNAGANPPGEIDDIADAAWRAAWDLKLFSYINLTRALYAAMKERRRGVIVNIIGNSGERMNSRYILGSSGNIALMGLTRALGARSPDFGVRVVGVNPGLTATDRAIFMLKGWAEAQLGSAERWQEVQAKLDLPFGRMGEPKEVAEVVAFLASPRAAYVSGTIVTVDGGAANRSA